MPPVNAAERLSEALIDYSICTLVTDHNEYKNMLISFWNNGFVEPKCEFLFLDNSRENKHDGFEGVNVFLRCAKGRHIIICHQDVELLDDGVEKLDRELAELEGIDGKWALAGNAGGKYNHSLNSLAIRITDPHGEDVREGPFPSRATSLDENFLIIKASSNLSASGDLKGFHLYAMDLSIIASILGYNTYVIDFHLKHKSPGKIRALQNSESPKTDFDISKASLRRKYSFAFSPKWYRSPATEVFVWPRITHRLIYNVQVFGEKIVRPSYNRFRRVARKVQPRSPNRLPL